MSAAVDTMDYKLPYHTIFGGVSAFSKVHFEVSHVAKRNGLSSYYGEGTSVGQLRRFAELALKNNC